MDTFLALPVVIALLKACARMRRPWIEGAYDELLDNFTEDEWNTDSFKRTLGKRARQKHGEIGLLLDQTNVKTRYAPGFSRAARYRLA